MTDTVVICWSRASASRLIPEHPQGNPVADHYRQLCRRLVGLALSAAAREPQALLGALAASAHSELAIEARELQTGLASCPECLRYLLQHEIDQADA
ncbi:hypothetical protein [Thiomonas sp.]